jgi:hypothetical protein
VKDVVGTVSPKLESNDACVAEKADGVLGDDQTGEVDTLGASVTIEYLAAPNTTEMADVRHRKNARWSKVFADLRRWTGEPSEGAVRRRS